MSKGASRKGPTTCWAPKKHSKGSRKCCMGGSSSVNMLSRSLALSLSLSLYARLSMGLGLTCKRPQYYKRDKGCLSRLAMEDRGLCRRSRRRIRSGRSAGALCREHCVSLSLLKLCLKDHPYPPTTYPQLRILTSQSGDRNVDGLTYGGSLFRGSGFWAAKLPLAGGNLTDHAAIGYGEVVYILGGADTFGNVTTNVWKYDTVLHTYTRVAPMPQPRYRFGAALINNVIYVVGGRNLSDDLNAQLDDGLVKSTFIYDILADKWTVGADSLEYHGDNCAAALDGKVYLIGGYGIGYSYLNITEVYDPAANTWTRLADMPTPRGDLMCAALDGEIYALGGYYDPTNENPNSFSSKMESYNPSTGKWTSRPDLLTPRGDAAIAVLEGDRILLVGGEGHYRNNDTFKYPKHVNEVYYASDQTWVQKAMIPTARFRTAAATSGGLTFVIGGADVCIDQKICPGLSNNEVFLDVDHPHVYIYVKNEAYNDNAALTTYPL